MFFSTGDGEESQPSSSFQQGSQRCRRFQFKEIQQATNDFDPSLVIGHGGFGKVYKANVFNGSDTVVAAIKRFDSFSNQGAAEFWAEVENLSRLRHNNVVCLIGYCNYENEMIVVYEYISDGTLQDHLHKLGTPLSWLQRLNICIGAARGLDYIHTGQGIIHRDVKSSNILLQESLEAKITDFGLSKADPTNQPSTDVSTAVKGTYAYVDPEYMHTGRLTRKSDVYSFGVVLLEVLCRRRAIDTSRDEGQWSLASWAQECIKKGKFKHIIDSDIRGQISPKCLKKFVRIVERSLHNNTKQRCTMAEVVVGLESVLTLQENVNNSLHPAGETIFSRMVDMLQLPSRMVDMHLVPSEKEKSASSENSYKELEPASSSLQASQPCHHFEFPKILEATSDFDESLVIGQDGFGKVYIGNIVNGSNLVVAAIKRLDSTSGQGAVQFWAEVDMLSKLRHWNIVSLIGYCHYGKEMILVYEYMPNGTLEDHLHTHGTSLSWLQRLNICLVVARGLDYLHTGKGIIHRDVKSSNILLEESLEAKIGGFGLSKAGPMDQPWSYLSTLVKGTFGYLDPEYVITGKLTRQSDVYSFGVVLLEMLCRRRAIDTSRDEDQWGLASWAQECIKKGKFKYIIDSDIRGQMSPKCLKEFVRIAERCLHNNTKQRCTMAEVVVGLESVLTLQENVNNSLQPASETIFSRMVDKLQLPSRMVDMHPVPSDKEKSASSSLQASQPCHHFEFPEILEATSDFDESLVIGHGGFGKVYKGNIVDGSSLVVAAIKRLDSTSGQGAVQFWAEVNMLSKFQHYNIVSLIGYCHYGKEMILVYEYMPNGTLGDHLHKHGTPLLWLQRLNICVGAAHGLLHLHTHTGVGIVDGAIHHDVKSLNILLNESWEAKISDFGLSEIDPMDKPLTYANTTVTGTFGYLDPACSEVGRLTKKSDVYAFGVVLLEVLCRRPALDRSLDEENPNLAKWAQGSIKKGNVKHIIDSDIRDQISPKCLKKFVQIVERCLQENPKHRSTMAEVVAGLESVLTLQEKFNISFQPQNNN